MQRLYFALDLRDDRALIAEAKHLLTDESPLVRGAAVWALSQLMAPEDFAALAAKGINAEPDETVRAEWGCANP